MKVGVIANCQAQPIAEGLRMLPGVEKVLVLPIHMSANLQFKVAEENFKEILNDENAFLITFPLKDKFKSYATESLKKNAKCNILTITNLYFSGLHPDITYIGSMGERLRSPMGDYHSKIIIKSFLDGLSEADCLNKFNHLTYQTMGFYDEFQLSKRQLIKRDVDIDITFAEEFVELCLQGPNLYTMNHPSPAVFHGFINKIAQYLGLHSIELPVEYLDNYLIKSGWWPYYPELVEYHRVKPFTPFVFKQPIGRGGNLLDLESFINLSYKEYESIRDKLLSRQVKELIT